MGISLIAFREVYKKGKWLSCEKPNEEYVLEDADCMQYSDMFRVLAGKYGSNIYLDYPNGLPSDLSKSFKQYVEYRKKKDAESTEYWKSINPNIKEVKTEWYNTTIQGILDFIKKQRDLIEETGYFPEEIIDEDALEKLEMFKNGIYAQDVNKLMSYYLKLYDENNYLSEFIDSLNETPCEGEYKGKFSDIKNNKSKRVMFYFT